MLFICYLGPYSDHLLSYDNTLTDDSRWTICQYTICQQDNPPTYICILCNFWTNLISLSENSTIFCSKLTALNLTKIWQIIKIYFIWICFLGKCIESRENNQSVWENKLKPHWIKYHVNNASVLRHSFHSVLVS